MNTELAALLATRVAAALPYLDRVTGLARLDTSSTRDGDATVPVKLPAPVVRVADAWQFDASFDLSFGGTAAACEDDPRYLVPDAGTVGILFFEDGGSSRLPGPASLATRQSNLTLLLWLNPARLDSPPTETQLLAQVERALGVGGPRWAAGAFVDVLVSARALPAEASLFGRYSFSTVTPLLLPPYRLLGLALTVQCRLKADCQPIVLPTVLPPVPC